MNTIDLDLSAPSATVSIDRAEVSVTSNMPSIEIGVPGLPGPPGPPGSVGGYRYTQAAPSASWPVTHNLNRHPAVTIVLDGLGWVQTDLDYIDDDHVTITFPSPVTGTADM